MTNPTYYEALKWASLCIEEHKLETESAQWLLLERLNWSTTDLLMHYQTKMPEDEWQQYQIDVKSFCDGIPAQYIIGHAYFFGMQLKVTNATLIPRPETEELVEWMLESLPQNENLRIVDIGTGTGAIALALKQERPNWQVFASDISEEALSVAKENAVKQQADITFLVGDLTEPIKKMKMDVVVSNPPYIAENEQDVMDKSVIEYEPHQALFATENGLSLYRRMIQEIAQFKQLPRAIFFEIGYQQETAVMEMLMDTFKSTYLIEGKKDSFGNQRMIQAKL
ncbi:peptide chain release factor N(5)-glutamine methyltransferase [Dellaglioa algida]|uniref:peptide chain release factor N(5)-glutamine methyltransferase n=1 Tax=Dellaglioa algida TaxID=105612 RepID=UPI0024C48082|nr:peptide chain release factor N(5)-glutamine methyltransferase [Dellaglioa algida]MDK1726080.1 peptide chain release factor N(5)-glutamine methyltransferase [Dellaglioa algida]